jgi:rfaE bifunctional protein kinase chain/domain
LSAKSSQAPQSKEIEPSLPAKKASMFTELFDSFKKIPVAVVGDVMLDTYWWGKTDRISPEAPVPVVALQNKEYRIGGAGNVALNLVSLGAPVSMHTVTGTDEDGLLLEMMMKDKGIDTEGVWKSADRITTNKIRIISRNQHMMRLDKEVSTDLAQDAQERFIQKTIAQFEQHPPAVVIFEDYNKGVLTENVIQQLVNWCKQRAIPTAVDPKRKNFFAYQGVDIFKPNLKECRDALNLLDTGVSLTALQHMHQLLHERLHHAISLITLSEHGVFYQSDPLGGLLPAHVRSIADVSGAGDTVIAVASLVYAATKNVELMAQIANLAGGLVCEEVGTVAIDAGKLLAECEGLPLL